MSSVSEIMSLVASLSIDDKLQLNHELSASMLTPKKAGKAKASKPSSRKGKAAAPGTMAWTAFVEHCKNTMPERFAPPNLPKDRLIIAKAIRLEDPTAYDTFRDKFIADAASASASANASATASAVTSDDEVDAVVAAVTEAVAEADATATASSAPPAVAVAEKPKPTEEEKAAKKAKAAEKKAAAAAKKATASTAFAEAKAAIESTPM